MDLQWSDAELTGQVLLAEEETAAGILVALYDATRLLAATTTNANGEFHLRSEDAAAPEARPRLAVKRKGRRSVMVPLPVETSGDKLGSGANAAEKGEGKQS